MLKSKVRRSSFNSAVLVVESKPSLKILINAFFVHLSSFVKPAMAVINISNIHL
jgi:hypothetical protein